MKTKLKILALVTAAIAAATALSGCRNPARDGSNAANAAEISDSDRLSAKEYRTKFLDTFGHWSHEARIIAPALYGGEEYYLDRDAFTAHVETARGILDEFSTFYPPKKLDKQHNEVLLAIDTERKWLDTAERAYTALENKDQAAFDEATDELQKYADESQFPSAVITMVQTVNAEIIE